MNRRHFILSSSAAALAAASMPEAFAATAPVTLPVQHVAAMRRRKCRIVVQHDVYWVMRNYGKMHPDGNAAFAPFLAAAFAYVDEPGTQIDALWWDIGGSPVGSVYPSDVSQPALAPQVKRWHDQGVDWVKELVDETRRRKLEAFWNHRISEVDMLPEGGHAKQPHPLKVEHPDWVLPATWWPHGMWNLASPGLREFKIRVLREIATRYDLDGIQIDFARHIPCLPVGRQWELRRHVTEFMRMTRVMLLEVAQRRGRPFLLAARVPQTLAGCRADGFDVQAWSEQRLVDILTLGSRTMDVEVEALRAAVGAEVQLQPCFDDHHTTDGYRYAPIEFLRGVFANHFRRGANSVVTFNWAMGTPEVAKMVGGEIAPLSHQLAFREIGDPRTMAGKDKIFAVERRGGYPWADGFFNRNDTAPLPVRFSADRPTHTFTLRVSDENRGDGRLSVRCILFDAGDGDIFECQVNGRQIELSNCDPEWKDAQIFSPKPQRTSGGDGKYKVDPKQRLLRIEGTVPPDAWSAGRNEVRIRLVANARQMSQSYPQIEKVEGLLTFSRR
jgi:hypothetical protein